MLHSLVLLGFMKQILGDLWHARTRTNDQPITTMGEFPSLWELFLVCSEVYGWNYSMLHPVRLLRVGRETLTVNFGKRWTYLIKRDSYCCQGAMTGPSAGMEKTFLWTSPFWVSLCSTWKLTSTQPSCLAKCSQTKELVATLCLNPELLHTWCY